MQTYSTDCEYSEDIDFTCDIFDFNILKAVDALKGYPDIVWASPPCECFSVASIGLHWNKDNTPKTEKAKEAVKLVEKTVEIINLIKEKNPNLIYIIENPRGKLRKLNLIDPYIMKTVTYCQYGEKVMKPTDIWTNADWIPRQMCSPGDSCHESSPRGSSETGIQGFQPNDYYGKSKVPYELCKEILKSILW